MRESRVIPIMKYIRSYIFLLGLWAGTAYAATGDIGLKGPLDGVTFGDVVKKITEGLGQVAIPIVAIMVIVGGFMIMTAGGKSEKVTTGRNVILYAVIGYAVILLASVVVDILQNLLGA